MAKAEIQKNTETKPLVASGTNVPIPKVSLNVLYASDNGVTAFPVGSD